MRLSIATKVFLGFAAVLVMSGAVSLFGIVQMHRIGQGLSLVSSGYFPLTRIAGSLEAFQKERERSTDRLLAEADPAQRASLIGLDRTYFARIADERLARAREQIQTAREGASARDRAALDRIEEEAGGHLERMAATEHVDEGEPHPRETVEDLAPVGAAVGGRAPARLGGHLGAPPPERPPARRRSMGEESDHRNGDVVRGIALQG